MALATAILAGLNLLSCSGPQAPEPPPQPPNVLFISVDDLNDWIEPLGGHPQARTPNLSRLAAEGITFRRSYTPSPSCNPARTAILTGIHTYTSGMYSNYQYWREVLPDAVTLPRYFSDHGYLAAGAGKIFHNNMPDPDSWDDYFPSKEKHMPDYHYPRPGETISMPKFFNMYGDFDWSPIDLQDEETGDFQSVDWVSSRLEAEHDRPFFLACGIYRPHVPWYVPQKYFDLFPLEEIELPEVLEGDLDDLPERAREIAHRGGGYHDNVLAADEWKQAVQGYLASIAYADAMVGKLLDALETGPNRDNTIVVLWSDHGWQLGEKEHWRKFALWENTVRTVLMFRAPRGTPGLPEGTTAGSASDRVVSLIDLYPTLIELAGLPAKSGLDGRSLVPLLRDPAATWDFPAISTYHYTEFSIRDERWRYTRYIDGGEELYDHEVDPEEWHNLASSPDLRDVMARLAAHIPADPAPMIDTSYELMPHHLPPYATKEDWERRREFRWDVD